MTVSEYGKEPEYFTAHPGRFYILKNRQHKWIYICTCFSSSKDKTFHGVWLTNSCDSILANYKDEIDKDDVEEFHGEVTFHV